MSDLIILVSKMCEGCEKLKELLAGKEGIRFVDIESEEGKKYIKGDEIVVPSAVSDGARCIIDMDENGSIFAQCEDGREIKIS